MPVLAISSTHHQQMQFVYPCLQDNAVHCWHIICTACKFHPFKMRNATRLKHLPIPALHDMYVACKCLLPHSISMLQMFPNAYKTTLQGADALRKLSKQGLVNISDLSKRITAGRYTSRTCILNNTYRRSGITDCYECKLVLTRWQNGVILVQLYLQMSSVTLPLKRKWETLIWSNRQMDVSPLPLGLRYKYTVSQGSHVLGRSHVADAACLQLLFPRQA